MMRVRPTRCGTPRLMAPSSLPGHRCTQTTLIRQEYADALFENARERSFFWTKLARCQRQLGVHHTFRFDEEEGLLRRLARPSEPGKTEERSLARYPAQLTNR